MVLLGFQGDSVAETAGLRQQIAAGTIGGVMYLRTNISDLGTVTEMNRRFAEAGAALPPLIALDQEGGSIERLTEKVGFEEIPSAERVAASLPESQAQALYRRMASGLARLGFNLNFGPVVDLNNNPDNPIIARYGRSFSADPGRVTRYAEAFVLGHRAAGVLTALKHFPGHGSSTADSHEGFVDITGSWQKKELWPYEAMASARLADMVMVGHLYHADYDGGAELPASLSPDWLQSVLREQIGFDGVVITDDMEMGAIRDLFERREAIVRAVRAGVDILLFSNTADYDPELGSKIVDVLVSEAERDADFRTRIEESYQRIVGLKRRLSQ